MFRIAAAVIVTLLAAGLLFRESIPKTTNSTVLALDRTSTSEVHMDKNLSEAKGNKLQDSSSPEAKNVAEKVQAQEIVRENIPAVDVEALAKEKRTVNFMTELKRGVPIVETNLVERALFTGRFAGRLEPVWSIIRLELGFTHDLELGPGSCISIYHPEEGQKAGIQSEGTLRAARMPESHYLIVEMPKADKYFQLFSRGDGRTILVNFFERTREGTLEFTSSGEFVREGLPNGCQ